MPNRCTTCLSPEPIVLHYALTPSAITNTLPKPVRGVWAEGFGNAAGRCRREGARARCSSFELIDVLNDWLADNPKLRRIFAIWIRAVVLRRSKRAVVLPKTDCLRGFRMQLDAERAHDLQDSAEAWVALAG